MKRFSLLIVAALAVGLVAIGCGGSSDSEISKAEFIKQADAVCKEGEEQIQKDFASYIKKHEDIKKPTEADYAELVDTVLVPSAEQEIDDIRALGAPSGDEAEVEAMLDAREESIETARDEPSLVVKESSKVFGKASKLAKEYGLEACGSRQ